MRPLAARQDASPAALRLAIRRTVDGVSVDTVRRKGPIGIEPFDVVLKHSTALLTSYRRSSTTAVDANWQAGQNHGVGNGTVARATGEYVAKLTMQ
jgi:hypothetical protein